MYQKIRAFYRKHPDRSAVLLIILTFLLLVGIIMFIMNNGIVWGSNTDWKSQHFAIPEYFRTRFYETGDPFPDFAMQLGGGQNIFNFAYYGIGNPLFLPAYAMPWMPMSVYVQAMSMLLVLISSIMSYFFFKRHFRPAVSLLLAFMFLCMGPLIYHSHRHIMFVNYLPFLFVLLYACRKKCDAKNSLLIIVMSCCIMCISFYYSIGSFLAAGAYMIYLELEANAEISIFRIFKNIWKKILCAASGVICAAFLWLPALSAIISGREKTSVSVSLGQLLTPTIDLSLLLYSAYSAGLTSFVILSAIFVIRKGKIQDRFLAVIAISCTLFPIIPYLLNAMMYVDGKALIPFAPLLLILCGKLLSEKNIVKKDIIIVIAIQCLMMIISLIVSDTSKMVFVIMLIETTLTSLVILYVLFSGKKKILKIYAAFTAFAVCISINSMENFVKKSDMENFHNPDIKAAVIDTLESDDGLYRFADSTCIDMNVNKIHRLDQLTTNMYSSVSNPEMRNFRFHTSYGENRIRNNAIQVQPLNVVFNTLMGCRYRLTKDDNIMFGETKTSQYGDFRVIKNENAFPLGYASAAVMSEDEFNKLESQLQPEALLRNIIIPAEGKGMTPENTRPLEVDFTPIAGAEQITLADGLYTVNEPEKCFSVSIPLSEVIADKFLIVKVKADNRLGDIAEQSDILLTINGVKNKLTDPTWKYNNKNYDFTYVISSSEPTDSLELIFSEGYYTLSDFEVYTVDNTVLSDAMNNKDSLVIDRSKSTGDSLIGNIDVSRDGWFNISFPYDKGFSIKVDGNETGYNKTNTAFIGFPISQGSHCIEITYEAPLKKTGILVSLIGVILSALLLIITGIIDRKHRQPIKNK